MTNEQARKGKSEGRLRTRPAPAAKSTKGRTVRNLAFVAAVPLAAGAAGCGEEKVEAVTDAGPDVTMSDSRMEAGRKDKGSADTMVDSGKKADSSVSDSAVADSQKPDSGKKGADFSVQVSDSMVDSQAVDSQPKLDGCIYAKLPYQSKTAALQVNNPAKNSWSDVNFTVRITGTTDKSGSWQPYLVYETKDECGNKKAPTGPSLTMGTKGVKSGKNLYDITVTQCSNGSATLTITRY